MTREEAINHIKYGLIEGNYPVPTEIGIEALTMAIKALEQSEPIGNSDKLGTPKKNLEVGK